MQLSVYEIWTINNLCLWAVYASFKPGMIFGNLGDKIEETLGEYWSKPVISCPVCMPTMWAIPVYLILLPGPWYLFILYHLTMVGFNYILSQLISKHITVEQE
jgi:hypothetical protein